MRAPRNTPVDPEAFEWWRRYVILPLGTLIFGVGGSFVTICPTTPARWTLFGVVASSWTFMGWKKIEAQPLIRMLVHFLAFVTLALLVWNPDRTWWKIAATALAGAIGFEAILRISRMVRENPHFVPLRNYWGRFQNAHYRHWRVTSLLQWLIVIGFAFVMIVNISIGIWRMEREEPASRDNATICPQHFGTWPEEHAGIRTCIRS